MNDLFDALTESIRMYMQVDDLPVRQQRKVRQVYDKFTYNMDTVDGLVDMSSMSKDKDTSNNESK